MTSPSMEAARKKTLFDIAQYLRSKAPENRVEHLRDGEIWMHSYLHRTGQRTRTTP